MPMLPVPIELWFAYVGAILIMMSTPGPSQLLMLTNAMRHGFRPSLATAAGDLSANVLQMLVAGLGLVTVLAASREAFLLIKWAGVAYLAYMGLMLIYRPRRLDLEKLAAPRRLLYMQGFLTSAANPRAVFFFAALFPQFIDAGAPLWPQLLMLGGTYLAIDATFLSTYGYFADWIARRFSAAMTRYGSRVSGGLLIAAAVLLGLRDVEVRAS